MYRRRPTRTDPRSAITNISLSMIRHKEKMEKKRKKISQRRQEEVTIHELINMTYVEPDEVGVGGEWAHLPISRVAPARLEGKGRDLSGARCPRRDLACGTPFVGSPICPPRVIGAPSLPSPLI